MLEATLRWIRESYLSPIGSAIALTAVLGIVPAQAAVPIGSNQRVSQTMNRPVDQTIACEVLVVGGGLSGVAAAYEALKAGRTVCLTELTDWLGGQASSQGTSALDEKGTQRSRLLFAKGYTEFRQRLLRENGNQNPGSCWVSAVCYLPQRADQILQVMLQEAARQGRGKFLLFTNTVPKSLQINGKQLRSLRAIQHRPAPGAPPLNTEPLSQTIVDSYQEADSARFSKTILQFVPPATGHWLVIEATETGELLAMADLPYRVGGDARSYRNPSAASAADNPYCPQAFTYPFAMEATTTPRTAKAPVFYDRYARAYSFNDLPYAQSPELVFTYRRIHSVYPKTDKRTVNPGDISMQNWNWGNDYGPGTATDNYLYTRQQLATTGQLQPGGWLGGLRPSALRGAEEQALGFFHWFHSGSRDAKLPIKKPYFRLKFLQGYDAPMGTAHGLSKYPYLRESRRLVGRAAYGYPDGFAIDEGDFSQRNFSDRYYIDVLSAEDYRHLAAANAGIRAIAVIRGQLDPLLIGSRQRSRIYLDSVGIGHYPADFHPCMMQIPPERPGNQELAGERQAASEAFPFQIPLRAMIAPQLDNLIVTGKNMAMSHIGAAAYRVHAIEWSAGAAAGTTAALAWETKLMPFQFVEHLPRRNRHLEKLQRRLKANGNPIAFPGTSIFNTTWKTWK